MYNAIYLGSFSPLHNGHITTFEKVLGLDIVRSLDIILTPHNPSKDSNSLLPYELRKSLILEAMSGLPGLRLNEIECELPRPNYTYRTIRELRKTVPELAIVLGTDVINDLHHWEYYEEIVELPIIHIERLGYSLNGNNYSIITTINNIPDISSTDFRRDITLGVPTADLVKYLPINILDILLR